MAANYTTLTKKLVIAGPTANVDYLYGPYESLEKAIAGVPRAFRAKGRTVGIMEGNDVLEYWWKSGVADEDLVQKQERLMLSLHLYGENVFTREEDEVISAQFIVEGGISVKKAVLYQVVNGNEVAIREYGNIGKGSPYTFIIPNPSVSGIYSYRIKVLDTLDNYAIAEDNSNYIEYSLHYGGISTVYNLTQLNAIPIKNFSTVAGVPFQLNISVRDDDFRISGVYLTDATDASSSGLRTELRPYIDRETSSESYLGNYYYYMPDSGVLEQFNGKRCSIVISYVEVSNNREKVQDLFKLLDISTLDIVPEYEGGDFYATLPAYYTFQLQSGVENLSVVLTPGTGSDFNFERSTVLAYRRFSLRVVPNDTIKNDAKIVINYRYSYNDVEYTGTFTRTIGNILALPEQSYYEPAVGSTTSMIRVIEANASDYTGIEDSQYYKTISETVSAECLASSFVLDVYCKINQQNDKSIKYLTVSYGGVEIATVTEDEISCTNKWRSLYTDTPLNEWTQIGIGINLQETFKRNDTDIVGYYHSIYVNGMVVKNVLIDGSTVKPLEYDGNRLSVSIGNGMLVQKCFLYYRNDSENIISPNTLQNDSIIYNNFKSHKLNFEEPQDLPVLKFLRISDSSEMETYFRLINTYKGEHDEDQIKHLTTFGIIGADKAISMDVYDPNYASSAIESNATLFRQSVDIKKPAQKEYAVLCRVMWMNSVLEGIVVEVHTQGTSTLVYSVPNFKFTFWRVVGDAVERYYPEFIQKEGTDEYYRESVYTAKADFMDSSHLNNTPTCNYYNDLIQNLIKSGTITGSPSARNGMLDAIMGFPIVMEISDSADDFGDIFTNIGSFMLNIDKTGASLGFEIQEDGNTLSCISFEGTSNDNDSGASGRFDIPEGVTLKNYMNAAGDLNETEIRSDYAVAKAAKGKSLNDTVDGVLVRNLPYVKWCSFLSDGLEYRYPDSDMYKEKSGTLSGVMNVDHFISLYKMWWWVYNSDTLTQEEYRRGFTEHFDLQYCMIYFIQLMIYAQTDNLGKNAMFDCWDGVHWYPRPYDLDSEAGLDNNGNDNIAPFVEIRPAFSLNYNIERANDYEWLAANYLLDEPVVDERTGEVLYPASTIRYGAQTYDRYHFSSNRSKLWINFYKNFKDTISAFYVQLRTQAGYNPETIISLCQSVLINKLGTAQYNQDFRNKYLANSDQRLAYGNRWYKFKKWLTKRFAFCDSYFGASDSAMYNIISRISYTIKVDAPQYVAQQYQGEANRDTRFVLDNVTFSAGSGAATIITILVNQPSVYETSLFKYVTFNQGARSYNNLITLDVSGNRNSLFTDITSVTGSELSNLKYLNVSNSAVQNLSVPANVRTLLAEDVSLSSFIIPDGCAVETISLRRSTFLGSVDFSMLPNLKKLDLTDCTFNQPVMFASLPQLSELIMSGAVFNNVVTISDGVNITSFDFSGLTIKSVSFSGSNLQIDTVNFRNTKFGVSTLNLNAVRQNLRNIYFDNCQGLSYLEVTDGGTFNALECISLTNSSVKAFGANSSIFDCRHFSNMGSLKKVGSWRGDGKVNSYTGFTFQNTVVEQIVNMNWTGSGVNLFRDAQRLTSIGGTLSLTGGIDYMCYRCYQLATLPTINISNTVTTATYAFAAANSLSYSGVANVIRQCTNVTNFSSVLRCKKFEDNQTIALNLLFGSNPAVINLSSAFSCYVGASEFPSVTNKIIITGKIPSQVTDASWMFFNINTLQVPYDLIVSSLLANTSAMFAYTTITFTGNGLPVQTDSHDTTVTLTNAVNKNFFCNNLTNVAQMFFSSNVITNDATLFANLSGLTNTNSTFGSYSIRKFSFVNSSNETEDVSLNVINMWANNPNISDISGCFANVYNVFCTGLNFHTSVNLSKTVNISGLFGLANSTYRTYAPITIDLDAVVPNLRMDSYYAVPTNGAYAGPGVFQNRSVSITSAPSNGRIFGKLNNICRNLFNSTVLYLYDSVTRFDLSNVLTSCEGMFRGCRLYKQSSEMGHTYTVTDRKFVDVTMPTNCANYSRMFQDSSVLRSLPSIASSGASNLSYMYQGCVINTADLSLPSNYFAICAGSLSNVAYMFCNNMYLTTLDYSASRGLFEGCVNLSNVGYMFYGASFLHKGIPVNLFGETELPKLTSLAYMFGNTSIIYDVEDNSHKWMNATTIEPLVNLDNISGMFYRIRINGGANQFPSVYGTMRQTVKDVSIDVAVIAPDTFTTKTLTNITKLFEHTVINPPASVGGFRFSGFTIGTDAFFSSYVSNIDSNFVEEANLSSIANADRMFYQSPTGGKRNGRIDGLSVFVNSLIQYPNISKYNIAGNLVDEDIAETYKASTTEGDTLVFYGFGLQVPADPESSWANYGRYMYA